MARPSIYAAIIGPGLCGDSTAVAAAPMMTGRTITAELGNLVLRVRLHMACLA